MKKRFVSTEYIVSNQVRHKFSLLLALFIFVSTLNADFFVQDELTKVFNVSPGEIINSSVVLYNPTDRAVNIRLYQGDYTQDAQGENISVRAGSLPRSNASWIRFQSNITLPPHQTLSLPFSINVPNQSDLNGSYWSDLFVEEATEITLSDPENIAINLRTAVQIINNITNTDRINLMIENIVCEVDLVSLTLRNNGNRWFQASVTIDVYNDNAELVGSFIAERNRVYPDFTRRVQIPVRLSSYTNYHAIIVADCGDGYIFGHQISFIID